MGFLEGLGRSRAITGTLSAIDQLKANEQSRAINAQNIRMNEMEMVNQERAFQYQQQQIAKQEEENRRPVDITLHPLFLSLEPETQKWVTESMRQRGIIDANGIGERGAILDFGRELESTSELFKPFGQLQVQGLKNKAMSAVEAYNQAIQSGETNEKKLQQLQIAKDAAYQKYTMALGTFDKGSKQIGLKEQAKVNPSLKTVDEFGNPVYATEYGERTNLPVYESKKETEPYKIGTIRAFDVGNKKVYKQYLGEGEWETIEGVGGPRYKETTGGSKGGNTYEKNVTAYKREVASIYQEYDDAINQPEATGNSKSARILRGDIINKRNKNIAEVVKKYRGKIDFLQSTLSSQNVIKYDAQGRRIQ